MDETALPVSAISPIGDSEGFLYVPVVFITDACDGSDELAIEGFMRYLPGRNIGYFDAWRCMVVTKGDAWFEQAELNTEEITYAPVIARKQAAMNYSPDGPMLTMLYLKLTNPRHIAWWREHMNEYRFGDRTIVWRYWLSEDYPQERTHTMNNAGGDIKVDPGKKAPKTDKAPARRAKHSKNFSQEPTHKTDDAREESKVDQGKETPKATNTAAHRAKPRKDYSQEPTHETNDVREETKDDEWEDAPNKEKDPARRAKPRRVRNVRTVSKTSTLYEKGLRTNLTAKSLNASRRKAASTNQPSSAQHPSHTIYSPGIQSHSPDSTKMKKEIKMDNGIGSTVPKSTVPAMARSAGVDATLTPAPLNLDTNRDSHSASLDTTLTPAPFNSDASHDSPSASIGATFTPAAHNPDATRDSLSAGVDTKITSTPLNLDDNHDSTSASLDSTLTPATPNFNRNYDSHVPSAMILNLNEGDWDDIRDALAAAEDPSINHLHPFPYARILESGDQLSAQLIIRAETYQTTRSPEFAKNIAASGAKRMVTKPASDLYIELAARAMMRGRMDNKRPHLAAKFEPKKY